MCYIIGGPQRYQIKTATTLLAKLSLKLVLLNTKRKSESATSATMLPTMQAI